jgi:glycosyltransferase involved in cell wall biosynthesis
MKTSKLSLLIPRDSSPDGGVSSHIETLIRALPKDFEVRYFFPPQTKFYYRGAFWAASGFRKSQARIMHLNYRVRLIREQIIHHLKPNSIIHTHDVIAGWAALTLRQRIKSELSVVHTVHGPLAKEIRMDLGDEKLASFAGSVEKKVFDLADALIAVDQGQKDIVVNEFNIPKNRVKVIRNAVDAHEVKEVAKRVLSGSSGHQMLEKRRQCKRLLVLPRRLVEKNGPLVALRALNLLPEDVHLWVVGDGPLREGFEAEINTLGLSSRVWLLGNQPRSQTIAAISLADIVLVPSVPSHGVIEATSVAALEGMALAKVVVASNIGGLAELIQGSINGILFEAGDHRALAEVIQSIDINTAHQIGKAAQALVEGEWSVDRWVNRIVDVYKSVL